METRRLLAEEQAQIVRRQHEVTSHRVKVLVVIANYGTKNLVYLAKLLDAYRSMAYDTHVVVLSDALKDLGSDVELITGLPGKDPRSLPFAHKQIFADRLDDYDLFIYSEDDTLIEQRHIDAFVKATEVLPADRIAGFLRYEKDADGHRYCSTIHAHFHWVPGSVQSFGAYTFAHFTNEHSAGYILTRDQLRRAIASGGFLVPPHQGRYDRLCSAATDPFTQCGFTKVICISHIEDFLVHHLPNCYLGKMGCPFDQVQAHINALLECRDGRKTRAELLPAPIHLSTSRWNKMYFEPARQDILRVVPHGARQVLSVGCGAGATEAALIQKGIRVVGIPLDAVIAESAKEKGVELTEPDFREALQALSGRRFDCILLIDVLQHVEDPPALLTELSRLAAEGGQLILSVPNLKFLGYRRNGSGDDLLWRTKDAFASFRLHCTTPRVAVRWVRAGGLQVKHLRYDEDSRFGWIVKASCGLAGPYISRHIIVTAQTGT